MDKILDTHQYYFDDGHNDEHLTLTTVIYTEEARRDDEPPLMRQDITLMGRCNSAEFSLLNIAITPAKLRELANELESLMNLHKVPQ